MKAKSVFLATLFLISFLVSPVLAETCSGNPHACGTYNDDSAGCASAGCNYNVNNGKCNGSHDACSTYSSQSTCQSHSCTWTNGGTTTTTTTTTASGGGVQSVIGIFPRIPSGGESINYGNLELRVEVYFAGEPSNGATIRANSTLFSNEVLLKHSSDDPDGMYKANVSINGAKEPGDYKISYFAEHSRQYNEAFIFVSLRHTLKVNAIEFVKDYAKGSMIFFRGVVLNEEGLPEKNALVEVRGKKNQTIFEITGYTDEEGKFSVPYAIKYSDPEGSWDVELIAVSENRQVGSTKIYPTITTPSGIMYYNINFLSPLQNKEFKRGASIPISVELTELANPIESASVFVYTPFDEKIILEESSPGKYSGNYFVKSTDAVGDWVLKAEANKTMGSLTMVGGTSIPIKIDYRDISFILDSLNSEVVYTNSRIKFKSLLKYDDGSSVQGAEVIAHLSNGKVIPLFEKSTGEYLAEYFVDKSDVGTLSIEIRAIDAGDNLGTFEKSLFVRKRGFFGNALAIIINGIMRFWWAISLFLIIIGIVSRPVLEIKIIQNKLNNLKLEKKKIRNLEMEMEKKYYDDGSITKENFKKIMNDYETRLAKTKEYEKDYGDKLKERLDKYNKKNN